MIDVDLLSVIRRWHGRDKLSIREIARRTGLSRNTITKYLASGEVTPDVPGQEERQQARSVCGDAGELAQARVEAQPQAPP